MKIKRSDALKGLSVTMLILSLSAIVCGSFMGAGTCFYTSMIIMGAAKRVQKEENRE